MKLYNLSIKTVVLFFAVAFAVMGTTAIVRPAQASAAASGCVSYSYRKGSYGTCVKYIQRMLNSAGNLWNYSGHYKLWVDGSFGTNTNNNAVAFQKFRGLTQDGIVGPNTWFALCDSAFAGKGYSGGYDAWLAGADAGCGSIYYIYYW